MPPDNPFDRALDEVADGRPIDWAALEQQARNADELEIVQYLRLLAAVADVHSVATRPLDDNRDPSDSAQSERAAVESADDASESWGKYRLVEKVGEGGFGSVHRAWDPELEREVAIKILHQDISDGH